MIKLDRLKVENFSDNIKGDELKFLNLSGRKALHSQEIDGEGIIIAVVDTGVNSHPELENRLLQGMNFCSYRNKTDTRDDHSHGTHVSGSIAGMNVGIAPKSEILPVKVLSGDGDGDIKDLTRALNWIRKYRHKDGRKVTAISMSLSTDGKNETRQEMKNFHQAIKDLVNDNIAVICSAGNSGKIQDKYPASYSEVICVGAVDINKERALFSTMGDHVDLCQIGVDVLSSWYKGGYARMSGTSMSTPIVSGIAALIACKHKQAFNQDIAEDYLWKTLKLSTKDLGIRGADREFGVGFCTLQPLQANIWMQNNNKTMVVNGKNVEMDIEARIEEPGRFIIPARFFTEFFGTYTSFNPENQSAKFIS